MGSQGAQCLPANARARSSQQLKRGAQPLFGAGVSERISLLQLGQRRSDLGLAKAEPAQGGEELGVGVERAGSSDLAVLAAIGVAEGWFRGGTQDGELAAIQRAMMDAADRKEVLELVPAAFGAELDVMQVEVQSVPAARDSAAAVVAQQHGAT
jgi:hypothetical protein